MQQKMMENIAMQMFDKPLTILTTVNSIQFNSFFSQQKRR